jgi:hypothetical protein
MNAPIAPEEALVPVVTDDELAALKAQHGEVWKFDLEGGQVVFRCPTAPEFDTFFSGSITAPAQLPLQYRNLCRAVVLAPDPEKLKTLFMLRPGTPRVIALEIEAVASGKASANVKKG